MAIYGTLVSEKKSIESNERLNLKEKHQNSAKLHQIGLNEPAKDASQGLIVKKKTIRVLLDTGLVQVATSFSSERGLRNT